jgi:hypothetical protein
VPFSAQRRKQRNGARFLEFFVLGFTGSTPAPGTVPWTLRYMMARDPKLRSMVLDIFLRTVFANQRRRAKVRTVSIREAARLQSFPDAFEFKGNMGIVPIRSETVTKRGIDWAPRGTLVREARWSAF